MNYEEWQETVHSDIRADTLWRFKAYRLALFAADIGWHDVTKLAKDARTIRLADQLCRALGSVGANIAEGYSRGTGKGRALYYEYALGSARESRGWYFNARHILGDAVVNHRIGLLTEIIRLLLTAVPQQRGRVLKEASETYVINHLSAEAPLPEKREEEA